MDKLVWSRFRLSSRQCYGTSRTEVICQALQEKSFYRSFVLPLQESSACSFGGCGARVINLLTDAIRCCRGWSSPREAAGGLPSLRSLPCFLLRLASGSVRSLGDSDGTAGSIGVVGFRL